jgi:hypothetical protein
MIISQIQTITGQTNDNTIVIPNSSWSVLSYGLGAYLVPSNVLTQYIYFDRDSIVANKTYKKVFSCDDRLHENIMYEGLIREQDKKTYFIPKNSETESLLYDFMLEEGMNFRYQSLTSNREYLFYVKEVDFVEINGIQKKQIQLTLLPNDDIHVTWIENIGSLTGLFYSGGMLDTCSCRMTLLCYFQDNELIYKNPVYSECYYDKVENITSVQTIEDHDCSVFPNPIDNILTIFSSNNVISRIEIFDNFGRKVYDQPHKDTIDVSSFSKGIYLLKVYDINEQVSVFKIIKK